MVDALILVAVQDELEAVERVLQRDFSVSCAKDQDSAGLPFFRATLSRPGRPDLSLALVRAPVMGGAGAANVAGRFCEALHPQLLAMCGICAGNREKVAQGDVVVANKVWEMHAGEWREMNTFRPPAALVMAVEGLSKNWVLPLGRPVTIGTLGDRLLLKLYEMGDDATFKDPVLADLLPDLLRHQVLGFLRKKGLLDPAVLTPATENTEEKNKKWLVFLFCVLCVLCGWILFF